MKRLTISGQACVEILAILITVAWADGRLDDAEKQGIRGAAQVLNLTKELRDHLDRSLASPVPLDGVLVESLSPRDRAFAYVAAAWMTGVDEDVDVKEEALLERLAATLVIETPRRTELERIARDLPRPAGGRRWSDELVALFKAIPKRLESDEEIELVID